MALPKEEIKTIADIEALPEGTRAELIDGRLFLDTAKGYVAGRTAPILTNGIIDADYYINPIPAGLVLTGIVVSVSVTAFSLALVLRLYKHYGSLDMDEILRMMREEEGE